jgi:hypothetical protein
MRVAGNPMRYWITRHWPHPEPDDLPWHVYLKSTQRDEATRVSVGDIVLFYETGACLIDGRATTSVRSTRDDRRSPLPKGRTAVVRIGRAVAAVRSRRTTPYDYGDADYREWNLEIPCESRQVRRLLPHKELARIVGFRMYFKGGLREICAEQF